jgi:hypothetical protein
VCGGGGGGGGGVSAAGESSNYVVLLGGEGVDNWVAVQRHKKSSRARGTLFLATFRIVRENRENGE